MNIFLKSITILLFASSSLIGKTASELNILNFEYDFFQDADLLKIHEQIQHENPDMICIFNTKIKDRKFLDQLNLTYDFPFIYNDQAKACIILSRYELSHITLHDFGPRHTVVEIGSNDIAELIINAHLPTYSQDRLNTLKSYFLANNPYLRFHMAGDLAENNYLGNNYEYLILPCSKREFEFSAEGHKNGQAEVKVDARVSSDDGSKKLEVEAKYSKDSNGDSDASAKASFTIEY